MNIVKNILGYLVFAVVVNIVGITYLFGDLEISEHQTVRVVNLPDTEPLYSGGRFLVDDPELDCMARNIFHEARNQSVDGQLAVAFVTLNRVQHADYPDSICEVVYQPYQFSWTITNPSVDLTNPIEKTAWTVAKKVATDVLNETVENPLHGVTHYHADYVTPDWSYQKVMVTQIDSHVFYQETF